MRAEEEGQRLVELTELLRGQERQLMRAEEEGQRLVELTGSVQAERHKSDLLLAESIAREDDMKALLVLEREKSQLLVVECLQKQVESDKLSTMDLIEKEDDLDIQLDRDKWRDEAETLRQLYFQSKESMKV